MNPGEGVVVVVPLLICPLELSEPPAAAVSTVFKLVKTVTVFPEPFTWVTATVLLVLMLALTAPSLLTVVAKPVA